jgi:hypothetical protein
MNPFDYTTAADYVAFAAMTVVFVATVYLVIRLGDLPADIARKRNHPQVASVQALSWLGLLLTGGIVWIFAMTWAYYDYGGTSGAVGEPEESETEEAAPDQSNAPGPPGASDPKTGGAA